MLEQLTWQEICQRYPNEWVAVVNYEQKGAIEIDGVIAAHAPEKKRFHEQTEEVMKTYGHMAARYTGELIQESDLPLLWRIFPTT